MGGVNPPRVSMSTERQVTDSIKPVGSEQTGGGINSPQSMMPRLSIMGSMDITSK